MLKSEIVMRKLKIFTWEVTCIRLTHSIYNEDVWFVIGMLVGVRIPKDGMNMMVKTVTMVIMIMETMSKLQSQMLGPPKKLTLLILSCTKKYG